MKKMGNILLNDKFILVLIIINSFVIFLQGFPIVPVYVKNVMIPIDNAITVLFFLEVIVKIKSMGFAKFFSSKWNIFDTLLVLLALPSLYFWMLTGNPLKLSYFLVLRISRIFKFFRFIRFFPNIDHMMQGVQRALRASIVVLLGFLVYNFVVSVLSCYLFRNIAPEYFANPLISFYSVFKIFTVEGWYEIPDYIAKNSDYFIGSLSRLYFVFLLLTGGIFGLSLVNSIFVDAMVSDNNDELEEKVLSLEKKIDMLLERSNNTKA